MRLLTVCHNAFCTGAGLSAFNLLCGLRDRGVEIKVVVAEDGFLCRKLGEAGIDYVVTPFEPWQWPRLKSVRDYVVFPLRVVKYGLPAIKQFRALYRVIKDFHPDVVHSNVSVLSQGFLAARLLGVPHMWHVREYGDRDFGYKHFPTRRLHRYAMNRLSYTITITKALSEYFRLGGKSRVIYNGIINDDAVPVYDNRKNFFLYAGYVTEQKGVTDLVQAFKEYCSGVGRDSGSSLKIIGYYEPKYKEELDRLLADSLAEKRVEFLGYREDVDDFLRRAKAVIVPSHSEGFGRVMAEAMHRGALVIGRNAAGLKEQFDNGLELTEREIGLRFGSVAELVRAMEQVDTLSVPQHLDMVRSASKTVDELYTVKGNINHTYEFLKEIVSDHEAV